jgi:hypothetical protein
MCTFQTNGLTERFNQTLVTQLIKVVNEKCDDWDDHLQQVAFSYRCNIQASTKFQPFQLLYGVKPRLPTDIDVDSAEDEEIAWSEQGDDGMRSNLVEERIKEVGDCIQQVREEGWKNIRASQDNQKKQYDLKHAGCVFAIGDKVLKQNTRKNTRKGDKLEHRWTGPYEIAEACGKGTYKLKDVKSGQVFLQKVNTVRLRRYNTESTTSDLADQRTEAVRTTSNAGSCEESGTNSTQEDWSREANIQVKNAIKPIAISLLYNSLLQNTILHCTVVCCTVPYYTILH